MTIISILAVNVWKKELLFLLKEKIILFILQSIMQNLAGLIL